MRSNKTCRYACYCFVYGHGKMIAINFLLLGKHLVEPA